MKHYVAIGEAPIRLDVSTKTIRRWDKAGKIQCYRIFGGHRRNALIVIERIVAEGLLEDLEGTEDEKAGLGSKTAIYARVRCCTSMLS